ncbi:MAG: hypothetical protein HY209_05965 [Candidatus Omnitrophica bacterium]|nr:hypothetical protein [Candidatus Omnitrophota bacterium]
MRQVILVLLGLSVVLNAGQLALQILEHQRHPSTIAFHSLGDKFKGLETVFSHVRAVGYYTDKNIDEPLVVAQFEQAQYLLAPTVLDLNHTDYAWVIFDCTSPQEAFNKIKELGLQPLKMNNFGIILAFNPQAHRLKP